MRRLRLEFKHKLVIPAIATMMLVMIFPLLFSLRTSLYYYVISKPFYRPFIWFNNYKNILTDHQIWGSSIVTLKFSIASVFIEMLLGFLLAFCLTKIPKFNNFFLSILIIPMMISSIAIGLSWRLLLHPDLGIVNYILDVIGIGGRPWLALPKIALWTLIVVEVWRSTPFVLLMLYSALLSLPLEPYEAATIDGASELQKLRFLTLPMLRPVLIVTATIRMIGLIKTYDLIFIMTHGGPGLSTETLSYYIWRLGFTDLNLGQASAASYMIVIFVGIATAFLFSRLHRAETY